MTYLVPGGNYGKIIPLLQMLELDLFSFTPGSSCSTILLFCPCTCLDNFLWKPLILEISPETMTHLGIMAFSLETDRRVVTLAW